MTRSAGDFPVGHADERDLYLDWLGYLRAAVLRKLDGLTDEQARTRPDGKLISLLGIVNHLTHVEWRWIDGDILGEPVHRDEAEFTPGAELTIAAATAGWPASRFTMIDSTITMALSTSRPSAMISAVREI